jgi:hypothetical protein
MNFAGSGFPLDHWRISARRRARTFSPPSEMITVYRHEFFLLNPDAPFLSSM